MYRTVAAVLLVATAVVTADYDSHHGHHGGGYGHHGLNSIHGGHHGGGYHHDTHHHGGYGGGHHKGGYGHHDYHAPAYYGFEYGVHDPYYGANFGHKEHRDGHVTKGSYYVDLPDGRRQKVTYTADKYGYHPVVTYEGYAKFPKTHHKGGYKGGYH